MTVWKHHIAEHFEKDPSLVNENGVGAGGTVFRDFDKMKQWLSQNDKRRFYVAPINAQEEQLTPIDSLMANANEYIPSVGPFAPIEEWEQKRHSLTSSNWYQSYKQSASRDFPYAAHREGDLEFETGKPVKFPFFRNKEKAPNFGPRFQQDIEPHGRYIGQGPNQSLPNHEYGEAEFSNPLVIHWNTNPEGGYDDTSWKASLSKAYGGLKGRMLAQAIIQDGYDGIVTVSNWNGQSSVSEIVDLRNFK